MTEYKNKSLEIQDRWERAVERAAVDQPTRADLEHPALTDAAGLHIQSGAHGGAWTGSCSCQASCNCPTLDINCMG